MDVEDAGRRERVGMLAPPRRRSAVPRACCRYRGRVERLYGMSEAWPQLEVPGMLEHCGLPMYRVPPSMLFAPPFRRDVPPAHEIDPQATGTAERLRSGEDGAILNRHRTSRIPARCG